MPLIIALHITDNLTDKSLSSKDTIHNSRERERERGRERERDRERESTSIMQTPQSLMRTLSLVS